jgi:polyisoprenoid-binding protein YceI
MRHLITAAIALTSSLAVAAPTMFKLDVPHTQVYFTVNHLGFSNSTGLLNIKEGTLSFDDADWTKSKLDVTLNVGSLQMGDKTWNEHLSDKQFFNVAQFPTIRFVGSKVEKTGDNTGKVTGTMTLLGVSKPVSFQITKNKIDVHPMMKDKLYAGFSATGSLKRSDFGMNAYAGAIGDMVSFRIEAEAAAPAPAAK